MNTPGSSFRSHSLNSRIERIATMRVSMAMLRNAGIITSSNNQSHGQHEIKEENKDENNEQRRGFKQIEDYLIKKRTIEEISTSMVVEGTLIDRDVNSNGITLRIHTVYNLDGNTTSCTEPKYENLNPSLNITATCLYDEIENKMGIHTMNYKTYSNSNKEDIKSMEIEQKKLYVKQFPIGSQVKGVIIKVDYHTLEIYITTVQSHSPQPHFHKLGLSLSKSPKLTAIKSPRLKKSQQQRPRTDVSISDNHNNNNNNMRYSPYYSHKRRQDGSHMNISAPTSPFQLQSQTGPLFKPSLTRSSSNNSSFPSKRHSNDDQKAHTNTHSYYSNHYYLPSKVTPSPLYTAVQAQEKMYQQGQMHQDNLNEFDLLQNKYAENVDNNNHNHAPYPNKTSPTSNHSQEHDNNSEHKKHKKLWIDRIRNHELFRNPSGVDMMRNAFGINDTSSLIYRKPNLCKDWLSIEKQRESAKMKNNQNNHNNANEDDSKYNHNHNDNHGSDADEKLIRFDKTYLRQEQAFLASRWALKSGVDLAKDEKLEKAVKHYDVAIEWDGTNSAAFVAKGAALCHLGKLNEAEQSIRDAIKINPNTQNAKEYLNIILQKKASK